MRELIVLFDSLQSTDKFAQKMGEYLFPGAVLLFWGGMGVGKTTFSKSLCASLGVKSETVISPTYSLVNMYPGRLWVHHVDLYRLTAPEQMDDFDRDDLISEEGITLVEWPELIQDFLTDEPVLNLYLKSISENQRELKLKSDSDDFATLFVSMEQTFLDR